MKAGFGERVRIAVESVRRRSSAAPKVGIILGSGLSAVSDSLGGEQIGYGEIEGMPNPSVAGHGAVLKLGGDTAVLSGRVHFYEGRDTDDTVFPIAVLKGLGVKTLILTNAAGAVNESYSPGDIVLLKDQINYMGFNPLQGPNDDRLGPRFPDMSDPFSREMRALVHGAVAKALPGTRLAEGVYMAFNGPSYETPAEIRMARAIGADLVGMSTVPETIVANYLGMKVIGLSCATNMAAGILDQPLSHREVIETGKKAQERMVKIIMAIVDSLLGSK